MKTPITFSLLFTIYTLLHLAGTQDLLPFFDTLQIKMEIGSVNTDCNTHDLLENTNLEKYTEILSTGIMDFPFVKKQENLYALFFGKLENSSENQFLTINLLIIRYLNNQKMPFYKLMTKEQIIILFDQLNSYQRVIYLPELFKLFDIDCRLNFEEKSVLFLRHEKCLFEHTHNFKSEDKSKLNLIIPHHILTILQFLGKSNDIIANYCIDTFKTLLNMKEVLYVHLHRDQVISSFDATNSPLEFFKEICAPEIIHSFEVSYPIEKKFGVNNFNRPSSSGAKLTRLTPDFKEPVKINIKSFINLKILKLGSYTERQGVSDIFCPTEIFMNLHTLTLIHINIDKRFINWVKYFQKLEILILEIKCKISYKDLQELNSLKSIKNKIFRNVICTSYTANDVIIPSITISMVNEDFTMIETRDKNINPNLLVLILENNLLLQNLTSIILVIDECPEELFLKCLSFSKLETLKIQVYFEQNVTKYTFPSSCACKDTLKSLKLTLDVDSFTNFTFDISNIECLIQVREFKLKICSFIGINCVGFVPNSAFLQRLDSLELNLDNEATNDLFINLDTQILNFKKLKISGFPYDSIFYKRFFEKPSLKNSLETVDISDSNQSETLIINLQDYHRLQNLALCVEKHATNTVIKHLLNDAKICRLVTLKLYSRVFITPSFFNLILEIKELHLSLDNHGSVLFKYVIDNNAINYNIYNTIEVLIVEYRRRDMDLVNELRVFKRIFPNLKCLKIAQKTIDISDLVCLSIPDIDIMII